MRSLLWTLKSGCLVPAACQIASCPDSTQATGHLLPGRLQWKLHACKPHVRSLWLESCVGRFFKVLICATARRRMTGLCIA